MSTTEIARYDAMIAAIDVCHKVDEAAEIRIRARAMEVYAKQAMNTDAERKACEIRLRAERRFGELTSALERAPGKRTDLPPAKAAGGSEQVSEYQETLKRTGVSERTAQRWQELAAVPKKTFEDALRNPDKKPTTTGILATAKGAPKMNDDALWIWGRLRDFERLAMWDKDAGKLFDGMTNTMQDDLRRILPHVTDWLGELMEKADES